MNIVVIYDCATYVLCFKMNHKIASQIRDISKGVN